MLANFFFVVFLLVILFTLRTWWIWRHIDAWIIYEIGSVLFETTKPENPTQEESDAFKELMRRRHYNLAWNGSNPLKVIGLCAYLNQGLPLQKQKALVSDYYGQIKHLVKKGKLPTALVFWLKLRKHSRFAFRLLHEHQGAVEPIDYEVLSAPMFALAKIPLFGTFWKKEATKPLEAALTIIDDANNKEKKFGEWRLANALISAKLYNLTRNNHYMHRVPGSGITRNDDKNQLARIAKHLNLPDVESLFQFCEI